MSSTLFIGGDCVPAAIHRLGNFLYSITNPAYFDRAQVRNLGYRDGIVVHVKMGNNKYLYRVTTSELVDAYADPRSWEHMTRTIDAWLGALVQGRSGLESGVDEPFAEAIADEELDELRIGF